MAPPLLAAKLEGAQQGTQGGRDGVVGQVVHRVILKHSQGLQGKVPFM